MYFVFPGALGARSTARQWSDIEDFGLIEHFMVETQSSLILGVRWSG